MYITKCNNTFNWSVMGISELISLETRYVNSDTTFIQEFKIYRTLPKYLTDSLISHFVSEHMHLELYLNAYNINVVTAAFDCVIF